MGRVCSKCKKYKHADSFYLNKRNKIRSECKRCANETAVNMYNKKKNNKDIGFYSSRMASRAIQRCTNPHEVYKYYKENNITVEFSTHKEFKDYISKFFREDILDLLENNEVPSLDRVNPKGNYSKDNIRVISYDKNRVQGNKTYAKKYSKPVLCIYPNGEEVIFNSVKEAHEITKLDRATIRKSFNSGNSTRHGYKFELATKADELSW